MEAKELDELCGLVRDNKVMTEYVEKIWKHQYQETTNLPFFQNTSNITTP
jgi:Fe-S-cluster containining protein